MIDDWIAMINACNLIIRRGSISITALIDDLIIDPIADQIAYS